MTINIRSAQPDDYNDLCELIDAVDVLHRTALPQMFHKPDGPVRDRDYLVGLMGDNDTRLFVAERDGRLLGMVHVVMREAAPISVHVPRCYAYIENIVVAYGARMEGIGDQLMGRAHAWAAERGAETIELNVYQFNLDAATFFQSRGYKPISRRMSRPVNPRST